MIRGRLAPLLEGLRARLALSRTAQVQASLSRPVAHQRPAAPASRSAFNARVAALLAA
jgi:hypothetical protein